MPVPSRRLTALELNPSIEITVLPVPENDLLSKGLQIHHAWEGQIRHQQDFGHDDDCGPPDDHEPEYDDRHIPQASVNREAEHRPEHEGTHGMDCAQENSYEFPGVTGDASWNQKPEPEPDGHSVPIDSSVQHLALKVVMIPIVTTNMHKRGRTPEVDKEEYRGARRVAHGNLTEVHFRV
jgi:hypothetical protein